MSERPGRWDLLGRDRDPVPGTPEAVQIQADHYSSAARTIASQVDRLRQLGNDDHLLKGEFADGLQESCRDTADDLERVHGRFETVGRRLEDWVQPVRTARRLTQVALDDAEAADRSLSANPGPGPRPPGSEPLTDAQQDQRDADQQANDRAEQDLAGARERFDAAMRDYDGTAEDIANAIRSASDDDMKDSRWDKFKSWVDDNAGWLKSVATAIGWFVTLVAVIGFFITPVGWVIAAGAAILAVIGLGIRVALASSGNGSWADVAFDAVGVLSLGTGRIAATVARVGRSATLTRIGNAAGNAARTRTVAAARQAFREASLLQKPAVWLTRSNPLARWSAGRAAFRAENAAWRSRGLPQASLQDAVKHGFDIEAAQFVREIDDLTRLGHGHLISSSYRLGANAMVQSGKANVYADIAGRVSDYVAPLSDLKDRSFSYSQGGLLR